MNDTKVVSDLYLNPGVISICQAYIKQIQQDGGVPENLKKGKEKEREEAIENNFQRMFQMLNTIQDRLDKIESATGASLAVTPKLS